MEWRQSGACFSPEFRNRLDAVIQFGSLDQGHDRAGSSTKLLVEAEAQLEAEARLDFGQRSGAALDRQAGLRSEDGCAADGASPFRSTSNGRSPRSYCSASSSTADTWEVTLSEDGEKLKLDTRATDEPALLSSSTS